MYKVKAWAHKSARNHSYNPWSVEKEKAEGAHDGQPTASTSGEPEKDKAKKPLARTFFENVKVIALHSWMNVLLVFVPVGIAVHFANINQNVVFALNAIAIIPLAGLLTFSTEAIASRVGPTLGALMNVSFGNSVELIIFIIALVKNEIRIVQASLIGSILANMLLILGMSMTLGGLQYQEQIYDSAVTQKSAALLALASLSLLIPTAFHASFNDQALADSAVVQISRGTSVILLIIYVLYLLYQLKSHSYLYQGTPQHIIDEQTQPGILQRMDSSSSDEDGSVSSISTVSTGGGRRRRVTRRIKTKLGKRRSVKIEEEKEDVLEGQKTGESQTPKPTSADVQPLPARDFGYEPKQGIKHSHTTGNMMDPAATIAMNTSTPATSGLKRPTAARGFTVRPPPVFRAQSGAIRPVQQHHPSTNMQMRRFQSSPNVPRLGRASSLGMMPPTRMGTDPVKNVAEPDPMDGVEQPPINMTTAIVLLAFSTVLVALCAEFMVSSIEHLIESSPLSEAFVGLIILPIVGNAAEHVTAVTVAAKNKLDLSLGVALGSSIQIALFVTPLVIIIGWGLDKNMSLYFTLFETVSLFVSVFTVNVLCLDGRSDYLEGSLLCAAYIIIAVGCWFFPDGQAANQALGGTAT